MRNTILFSALLMLPLGQANAHAPSAASTGKGAWQVDALLSYTQDAEVPQTGVLPQQNHYDQAGLRLKHLDVSRGFYIATPSAMQGLISLGYHGDELELEQAWIQPQRSGWQIKVGQMLPDIGWLNQRHSHALAITDRPLLYKAFWSGQTSEAGISSWRDWYNAAGNWRFSSTALTTAKRNTRDNSGALLTSLRWQRHWNQWIVSAKIDGYWASLQQSGMQLFSETSLSHSHGDNASEFFSGHVQHGGLALALEHRTLTGNWQLQAEYQYRQEQGDLSSLPNQALDAQAAMQLSAAGRYVQLSWQSPQPMWQLALRYDDFHSDVELSRVNGRDLEQSRLNHHDQQPTVLTLAASVELWAGSQLRGQWYEALQHDSAMPQWQLLLQQSASF
jgi:hypothetical protein